MVISLSDLMYSKLREESLGFFVGHGRVNDYIVAFLPVDRGGNSMLITDLEGY